MIRRIAAVFLLAVGSAVPGLNVLVFGYVLDVEGRIARGKRLRDAMPHLYFAPRAALFVVLFTSALAVLGGLQAAASDTALIDPTRGSALLVATYGFAAVVAAAGVFTGVRGRYWIEDALRQMDVRRWLRLGVLGVLCTVLWLAVPVGLLVLAQMVERGGLFAFIGLFTMLPVLVHLPFLQAHVATTGTPRSILAWREARDLARRAPLAHAAAIVGCFALATPLHLVMIVPLPPDAAWLPALLFVPFALMSRTLVALAYRRSREREIAPRGWRWLARPVTFAATVFYALVLFAGPRLVADGSMMAVLSPMFGF